MKRNTRKKMIITSSIFNSLKKKRIIMCCTMILLIVVIIGIIYNMTSPIVTMSRRASNGEQVANECGFTIDTAKEVLVRYVSDINDGNLTIRLTDENLNTIKEFQTDEEGKENIYLEKGKYYIRVESEYFKGTYRVKVYD